MSAVVNRLIDVDVAIPDFQIESTLWISADPGFILNSSPLTAEIR
jgi:hypothetical protein